MRRAEAIRGTAVAVGSAGLLITGATGTGKSALALALIARGALLVADDQVLLRTDGDRLTMSAPGATRGLIEMRGIGLVALPAVEAVPLCLIADLDEAARDRLPPLRSRALRGRSVPLLSCRDWPGAADGLFVLLSHGRLVDPDHDRAGAGRGDPPGGD